MSNPIWRFVVSWDYPDPRWCLLVSWRKEIDKNLPDTWDSEEEKHYYFTGLKHLQITLIVYKKPKN